MKNIFRFLILTLLLTVCGGCCILPVGHGHGQREGGRGENHGERRGGDHGRGEHHDRN
ncbi:MAG: hypothetical protein ACYC7L_04655 [Nitrospirota bacterium]